MNLLRSPFTFLFDRALAGRIARSFFLLFAVVAIAGTGITFVLARSALLETAAEELDVIAVLKAAELNEWVDQQARLLSVTAASPGLSALGDASDSGERDLLRRLVHTVMADSVDFVEVFVMAPNGGRVLASTNPAHEGHFNADREFFTRGIERTYVQTVYEALGTGRPTMTVAAPIRGADGSARYVLAAHLDLEQAAGLTDPESLPLRTARAYLVTESFMLVSAEELRGATERGVRSEGILKALAREDGVEEYQDYEGQEVIGAFRWISGQNLALLVEASRAEVLKPAGTLTLLVLLTSLATGLIALVTTPLLAHSITRPVSAIGEAAAMVAEGDFDAIAPERGDDEVTDLARSFNSMTARLRSLYSDLQGQIVATTDALGALEKNRSLLQAIVDNSTALIAVAGADDRLVVANEPLADLFGVDPETLPGLRLMDLVPGEISGEWLYASGLAAERSEVVQREFTWPGTDLTYLFVWFPLEDEESGVFGTGVIATDLSERKRIEEEKERFEAQLRHTQKLESLGVLAGGIAHDFNNILAAILGHADLAAECLEDDPEEVQEHLRQVVQASQKAAELTNQMLAYAGRASFRVETVELNEAIQTMSDLVRVSVSKKVEIQADLRKEDLSVRADPAQVSQILMNLITNAAQSIGDDAGTVRLTTTVSGGSGDPPEAVLTVSDTGCGMSADMIERIFDPFFTTKETGRGLGLAAVNGIVTGLGGRIAVESELGEGTRFRVFLPLAPSATPASEEGTSDPVGPTKGGTLLVVDDEDPVRQVACRALRRAGFSILEAADGIQALETFQKEAAIHGIVLDLSMPGMSGREVYEAVQELDTEVPVLFTSGYDATDAAGDILTDPHVRYLQKPYRPGELCTAVSELLAGEPMTEPATA